MSQPPQQPEPIPYASVRDPGQASSSPWPLIALVVVGLGLIVLGGCFCIGILLLVQPSIVASVPVSSTSFREEDAMFSIFLGFLAVICFGLGVWLLMSLIRKLLRRI